MKHIIATIGLSALLAPLALAGPAKYPVKKESVNPDYENGQLWDADYIQKNADSEMSWCRKDRDERGTKVIVDYKSFEDGFDYEMTHKKKVRDRIEAIAPWNACDVLCSFISLDPGLMIQNFPSSQNPAAAEELKQKITTLRCTYRNPDNKTHVEYDPKTKTLTGFMTYSTDTNWSGFSWATKAWNTAAMKKEFPAITKWIESH